ncbi:MAG: AraC family transcriptional regulator [Clostridia bacterium]|nr:AraC family transcriptional regulator [Clostridia bacterium]
MILRYHYFTKEPIVIPKLYSIGFASDTRVTRYGPTRRNQYLIHYIISGKGVFNGVKLGAGEGFITIPGMLEHYYPDENDPWRYLWIISYDPEMQSLIEMHNPELDKGIFKFHNIPVVEAVAEKLLSKDGGFDYSNTEITEMYLSIFNNCVQHKITDSSTNAKMYFDYTVKYISLNLHLPLLVSDICKRLGVSQPYLYRVFMSEVGISPKQYITECRLNEAKKQLLNTDFSISEISASIGFSDVLAFSKFFSSKMKLSPTEFRRWKK